jgi:hypothetical protein
VTFELLMRCDQRVEDNWGPQKLRLRFGCWKVFSCPFARSCVVTKLSQSRSAGAPFRGASAPIALSIGTSWQSSRQCARLLGRPIPPRRHGRAGGRAHRSPPSEGRAGVDEAEASARTSIASLMSNDDHCVTNESQLRQHCHSRRRGGAGRGCWPDRLGQPPLR